MNELTRDHSNNTSESVSTDNAHAFVEHIVTPDVIREAGFVEGVLVRKCTDKNPTSHTVWRITQVSDDNVSMLGEFDNAERTLTIELAKFESAFMLTRIGERGAKNDDR